MIHVIARIRIRPGTLEPFVALAWPCIEATRREPGCLFYDLAASTTDPDTVIFIERWRDREALEAHRAAPHLAAFRAASQDHVVETSLEIIHPERVETG